MSKKPFPFKVCEQCCGGDVSQEQIQEAVNNYLNENPITTTETDPTVPKWAKQPNKPTYTAGEVGAASEVILYEDVVNTPEWTNQPTYEGTLDSAFNTEDFYYVTLKDADGTSLENGYFKLMSNIDGYGSAYSTLFYLANYDTGNSDVLTENRPIEFVEISENVKMRVAGVHDVSLTTNWLLNGNKGKIIISSDGQFIPIAKSGYWYPSFRSSGRVSYWHSVDTAALNTDSTLDIIPYAALSVGEYTKNKFYDECILERLSDTRYATKRSVTLRYMKKGATNYSVVSYMPIGHGEILNGETFISKISLSQAGAHKGLIRNGTVIRVTEVK